MEALPQEETDADLLDSQDLYYLPKASLDAFKELLKGEPKEEQVRPLLESIIDPEKLDPEEILLPVDMRGISCPEADEFERIDELIQHLGPLNAAQAFLDALRYFEENRDKEVEEDRPKSMKASEWKTLLAEGLDEDDLLEDEEEGFDFEGEEEEDGDEDPEEEAFPEPAAKKAKAV